MKKALSWLVVVFMFLSVLQIGVLPKPVKAAEGRNATFVAVRFVPITYDRDGKELDPPRDFPWQKAGEQVWGRSGYGMPDSLIAVSTEGINVPAETEELQAKPLYWTDFYLTVTPAGGRSQETEHWYAVLDTVGQLWFDRDGRFNDSRYYEPADPTNLRGHYIAGSCKNNPLARVDPSTGNNTQGPYILDPTNPRFNATVDENGNPVIYFWDKQYGGRIFRLGWVDMVDYPLLRGTGTIPPLVSSVVADGNWDLGFELVDFVYWGSDNPDYTIAPDISYLQYYSDGVVHPLDELHTDNVAANSRTDNDPVSTDGTDHTANIASYDPGEYIYRKGSGNTGWIVEEGDIRLTPVSIYLNGEVKNYPPNSVVQANDWELNPSVPSNYKNLYRFNIKFDVNGIRTPDNNDEVHAENVARPEDFGRNEYWYSYESGEWIYRESGNYEKGLVTIGDYRLTNVNRPLNPDNYNELDSGFISSDIIYEGEPPNVVPRVYGDLLVLAEVLEGGCNELPYNLSVETDVWEGPVPSVTAAALRSPNDDLKPSAQTVQKNTVLDPDGSKFNIPATTFQNVKLNYREYIGVQIWKDNGIDNNAGMNFTETPPPPIDVLYPFNLSDDYREGRTGEEFLGAENGVYTAKDYGRRLIPFPYNVMYYDTADPINEYGCGEAIYRNEDYSAEEVTGTFLISAGDVRLTDVTVTIGNNVIKYKAGTTVSAGDADVGLPLTHFGANILFFDKAWPEKDIPQNWTYDVGENIYRTHNVNLVNTLRGLPPTPAITDDAPFYFGYYLVDPDPDPTNDIWVNNGVLYYDTDLSNTITPGDIRVFDLDGKYKAGSIVSWGDNDAAGSPRYFDDMLQTDVDNPIIVITDLTGTAIAAYVDRDKDGTVSAGDIRLHRIYSYLPYTYVVVGDTDIAADTPTDVAIALFDTTARNQLVYDTDTNGAINLGDLRITPYNVTAGDRRLTDVTISDTTYICGSDISVGNFWVNENPIHGLTMRKNGDFRYIDWEVLPTDQLGLNVKIDKPFKVEQTSQIDVTVDPAPRAARWEDGIYYPAEKVYVVIKNVEGPVGAQLHEDYKIITAENPIATFQFTPYRGSCPPNGMSNGWKKVWVRGGNDRLGHYELVSYDLRVRVIAYKDSGGVIDPAPKSENIIDPFWKLHIAGVTEINAGTVKGSPAWEAPPYPIPPLPPEMEHNYDCYGQLKYDVAPEDLRFVSSKKCVGVLDQRFPNLTMKLIDADNPNDVNDPNGLTLSVPNGEEVNVFYNAHNAGIDYLFTGYLVETIGGQDVVTDERVIVQVNLDGTYLYWHWDDVGPHPGMLDSSDYLWSPNPKYPAEGPERIPNYTLVKERPDFKDNDCSLGSTNCTVCGSDFRPLGYVSYGDRFGPFFVNTYGVPTYLLNYGERTATDPGGEIQLAVAPRDALTKLQVRIFTYNVLFDYNSTIKHPPYFIVDERVTEPGNFDWDIDFNPITAPGSGLWRYSSMGIDYCGLHEFKVLPPDPYVNFVELSIVDHALQNSAVNYTSGPSALSPLNVPTPQIQSPYNPIILDVGKDMRGYPGGQTHTGRLQGVVTAGGVTRTDQDHSGWNAYPAIWWWYWYENIDYNNFTDFNRLGTEFFPLTDYGLYFILKDLDGNHLSFTPDTPVDFRLRRVEITGPFATPRIFDDVKNSVVTEWEYNGMRNVPISYDWAGKITIDPSNYEWYENAWGSNWTNVDRQGGTYRTVNPILEANRQLNYTGLENVYRLEELIPIGFGKIMITVTLWDGTVKIFQDCCAEPPTDGVDVHALEISTDKETLTADVDNKVTATIKEYEVMQSVQPANDAFVFVWQDRGIINPRTKLYDGAGDGWVTNPPHSSDFTSLAPQFFKEDDLNEDGKISFADYETEIIGTYDLATNTWAGGVIDARTFQRNNGQYVFDLSDTNGAKINTVGLDFGGRKGEPDHVISKFETLPVMITAYKYGDDNNDRSFRPLYNFPGTTPQFSHEVYLSGQKFLDVTPAMDLSISVQPNPLTAGVTPELVDPVSPLTFILTDEEGNPVDLTRGVSDAAGNTLVENDDIWNHLFDDIHPDPLPEYYWLRTDLHNDDGTRICNQRLYSTSAVPFAPITPDFTLTKEGKYSFRGFCANDEGSFDVYIYTPDRKHAAKATVNVVLPTAEYSIVNTEDPAGTEFHVPGEPDFLLTAADNRIYRLTVTAKNAQGLLLKGVTKGVSTCGGGIKNTARFTPYSTRPASWDFTERDKYLFAEHFLQDLYPYTLNVGFDFNDNGKVDWRNAELFGLGGFTHTQNRQGQLTLGLVYYNTTLTRYDDGTWDINPNPNLPPPTVGWGLGAIYNSAHKGGYLFADIDVDKKLTYHDSLGLDVNAQTTYYIFAEDLAYIGGLVGDNVYSNNPAQADLAGYPPFYKTDPASIYKRFVPTLTPDGVFFLDWEAFPNKEVQIAPPILRVLNAKDRVELGKDLVNANNYDLVYATENHMIVEVRPADSKDLPMKEDGRVFLIGNQHQTAIYGHTKQSANDPKVMETTLHFTPTGLGEDIAYLGYFNPNAYYLKAPYELKNTSTYTLRNLVEFDSVTGLKVEVVSDDVLHPNKTSTITAKVTEIGTNAPVEGANVTVKGPGVNASKKTGKDGIATFDVTPNDKGIIVVTATMEGKIIGSAEIRVVPDTSAPWLEVDPLPPVTNKPQQEVTGRTNPGNTVTINDAPAQVAQDGSFKGTVTLKEGLNTIIVEAKNAAGLTTRKLVTITLDTTPPNIFIDDPGYLVDVTEIEITGRVEPKSKVTVNGQPATVTHDIWKAVIKVNYGKNTVTVIAIDQVGNSNTATKDFLVYKRTVINLTIDNPVPTINGEPQAPLEAAPFISGGRTMVPLRFISEALGAKVEWEQVTKGITITLGDTVIAMQVGSTTVMVNGKSYTIDAPPVIKNSRTFVPIRFISEILGAKVEWDANTRTVTITRDYIP